MFASVHPSSSLPVRIMLEMIIVVLVVLWALGYFGGFVAGGLIHALLVIALVVFIFRMMSGRKLT